MTNNTPAVLQVKLMLDRAALLREHGLNKEAAALDAQATELYLELRGLMEGKTSLPTESYFGTLKRLIKSLFRSR